MLVNLRTFNRKCVKRSQIFFGSDSALRSKSASWLRIWRLLPEAKIFIGVGAAFDLLTGQVRQAPRWMQRSGLEWFYRLTQEPHRLWRRYLVNNPLFIIRAGAQILKLRKYLREETT